MRYIDITSYMISVKLLCSTTSFCETTFAEHGADEPVFCLPDIRRCEQCLNLTLFEMSFREPLFCE